jgi:predicted transcriptional regulator
MAGGTTMGEKRTMTLNLSDEEMSSLDQLALRNDMSKTAVIRKAIRIYLILEKRMQKGEHIFVEDELHQMKVELLLV